VHGIHHDPEIYPNPSQFNPDRFSMNEISKRHNCSYLPFGDGLRGCIGMRFAMMEMKIAMAKILLAFDDFDVDETRMDVPIKFNLQKVLLSPIDGVYLRFSSKNL
jgi:cytochrome P450